MLIYRSSILIYRKFDTDISMYRKVFDTISHAISAGTPTVMAVALLLPILKLQTMLAGKDDTQETAA